MKKRLFSLVLAAVLMLAAVPAMAAAPTVQKAEYEGGGIVDVDFAGRVSYRNPKVTVKDSDGRKLAARIVERDDDDISFSVDGLKAGGRYAFVITGVRAGSTGRFARVKGGFSVPVKPAIRKVKYDAEDRELEIDFNGRVRFKDVKVTVKDASGRKYAARIIEKGDDDMEVRVAGLKKGRTYRVTVSGVALEGGRYTAVSKSFTRK